jgi:hypothetical protein
LLTIVAHDFPEDLLAIGVVLQDLFEAGLFDETGEGLGADGWSGAQTKGVEAYA